jgi:type IV pilus assembly protein PilM
VPVRGLLKGKKSVVGLDIEPGFVAAAEFTNGQGMTMTRAATEVLKPGLFHDGEVVDVDGLAEHLKVFFSERKLSRQIRLGVANQRVAVRVLELPSIESDDELDAAVRFKAQEELPMPLDQAVLDHRVLERFSREGGTYIRVLVVAVRRETVEALLAAVRKAGLTPELVDLSAFALVRSLYAPGHQAPTTSMADSGAAQGAHAENAGVAPVPGTLYCYVGGLTNLAIATGTTCLFNRVLPIGFESMASTLAERRGLTLDHSRQWLRHVGLEREAENIEGEPEIVSEAREVILQATRRIADEVRLSLEYYEGSVPDAHKVERMVVSGPAIAIPGFPAALAAELGLAFETRSLGNVNVEPGVLDEVDSSQLTVAAGLALDEVLA